MNKYFTTANFFSTTIKLVITSLVVVLYIHYFLPQSWGFYTTNPNVPLYSIYMVKNGIADKSSIIKNNMSYGMGISQRGRILYTELYNIIKNKTLPWRPFFADSINYIVQCESYIKISARTEYANFRGKFLITKTARPSYLDFKKPNFFYPAKHYILVEIR